MASFFLLFLTFPIDILHQSMSALSVSHWLLWFSLNLIPKHIVGLRNFLRPRSSLGRSNNFILSNRLCHQPINQNQACTSSCPLISTALLAPHSLGHHVNFQHDQTQKSTSWTLVYFVHASNLPTPWSWVLLGNVIFHQQSGNSQHFMETGISLPCSQKPATFPYPEVNYSSPPLPNLLI